MTPAPLPQMNRTLTAPAGKEATCDPLEVFVSNDEVISCWQLEPGELEEMQRNGGRIWVRVVTFTGTQPPIALSAADPFVPETAPNKDDVDSKFTPRLEE